MSTSQPPKLNYVKSRQKSKAKNEPESQQKILFQPDSSTDIFAHLNQDNLNYIKKQLKHKKSHKNQPKTSTQDKSQSQLIHQQKVYEKYKNSDQVTERDSRQQETLRQTQVDDSMLSDYGSINSKNLIPLSKGNNELQSGSKQVFSKQKQMTKFLGLQPPPLTYKKQSATSNEADNLKQLEHSVEFQIVKRKQTQNNANHKNPFQEYQLKSEASNNPIGNSTVSVENHLSQDLSTNLRPSQFIDRLQNYIEELNFNPQKTSKINQESITVSQEQELRNFRKKIIHEGNQNSKDQQAFESQRQNLSKQYVSIGSKRYPEYLMYHEKEETQHFLNERNQNERVPNKNTIKNYKHPLKRTFHQGEFQNEKLEELQKQVSRQKIYCMKLAVELEKYKENQEKYRKQIILLNKSIQVLKIQMGNIRQTYQKQIDKSAQIISYIQNQNSLKSKNKKFDEPNLQRLNQTQNNTHIPNYSSFKQKDMRLPKSSKDKQFQQMMGFSPNDQLYSELNHRTLNTLTEQFRKGKNLYHEQKRQRHPLMDINSPTQDISNQINNEILFQGSFQPKWFSRNSYNHRDIAMIDKKSFNKFTFLTKPIQPSPERSNFFGEYSRRQQQKMTERFEEDGRRKEENSLERLKAEYESFKAKTSLRKPEHRKMKSGNVNYEVSPRQFSQVFVK